MLDIPCINLIFAFTPLISFALCPFDTLYTPYRQLYTYITLYTPYNTPYIDLTSPCVQPYHFHLTFALFPRLKHDYYVLFSAVFYFKFAFLSWLFSFAIYWFRFWISLCLNLFPFHFAYFYLLFLFLLTIFFLFCLLLTHPKTTTTVKSGIPSFQGFRCHVLITWSVSWGAAAVASSRVFFRVSRKRRPRKRRPRKRHLENDDLENDDLEFYDLRKLRSRKRRPRKRSWTEVKVHYSLIEKKY